ncbi:MAG: amino acid adenylation domain-containing protein, partial [Planctomycetales bacterium]|nr:amino acid adenylation domain-containing protein [Planctomycetales bacterium]
MTRRQSHSNSVESTANLATNQRLIWLGQQLHPDTPLYEVPYLYTFHASIDPTRFVDAMKQLVSEHPVLRIVATDDSWTAPRIRPTRLTECAVVDFSNQNKPHDAADDFVNRRLRSRFRPTESLFEATLIRISEGHWKLLLVIHHALTDASAGRAILGRLSQIYLSELNHSGEIIHDPYAAYLESESALLQNNADEKQRVWFQSRSIPAERFKFYSSIDTALSCHQTREIVNLDDDENRAISVLTARQPFRQITDLLSHFNIFSSALIAWLSRLETRSIARIGATTHGRTNQAFRNTPGLFMQVLPFQVAIDADETFESLSRKVAVESMGFLANGRPGMMSAATQRAFDVAINVIDLQVDDVGDIPTSLEWLHNGYGDPERILTVSAHQNRSGKWQLLFDFSDDAFSATDRIRSIEHFRKTLAAMHAHPQAPLAGYDLLTETDQAFLSNHSGSTSFPAKTNLWSRFEAICSEYEDRIAVQGPRLQISYGALRNLALQLAGEIETWNCDDVVPVICRRDEKAIIAILGVLASGRCYLVVDAANPRDRRDQMLRQSGVHIALDATSDSITRHEIEPYEERASRDDHCDLVKGACYVLFTSGSTGQPNGVVVGHEAIWNLVKEFESLCPLTSEARCSWWTNIGFDVAMYEIWSALLFGRTLCLASEECRIDAESMLEWLQKERIESAYLPPFFLEMADRKLSRGEQLDLQRLLVGVEPIPQKILASIARKIPSLNLVNGYGPTEATVCATLHRIDRTHDADGLASIGAPIAGNQIRIADSNGRQVPPGVAGELWIGGAGLARGYLGNPELTARRFITVDSVCGPQRWYRTGDVVRQIHDGSLLFVGRVDEQIKIAGMRVEPAEIASAIRQCVGVTDCFVLPNNRPGEPTELIAFVESNSALDFSHVRTQLRQRLPGAMVPKRFVLQNRLPRNTNGKVDRAALRLMTADQLSDLDDSPQLSPEDLPQTPVQYTLLELARGILGVPVLGVNHDLFESGASSLDAMSLVSKANEVGVPIQVHDVLTQRTVGNLAAKANRSETNSSNERVRPETPSFTWGQRAIWLFCQQHPKSPAYHFQTVWSCNGRLDFERIADCFYRISMRHPALRTSVEVINGAPVPVVHDSLPPFVQRFDRAVTNDELVTEGRRTFDLSADSPIRIHVVQPPDGRDQIAITFHHIAVDQQSVSQIMREFAAFYRADGYETAAATELPRNPRHTNRSNIDNSDRWWQDRLIGHDQSVELPFDFDSVNESHDGELVEFQLPDELCQSLRDTAAKCGVTLGTLLLGSYACLISRYSGSERFTIGVPVSMRDSSRQDPPVGYAIESLPFTVCVDGDQPLERWLVALHDDFSAMLKHRWTSWDQLKQNLGPLFNTMFAFRDEPNQISLVDDLTLSPKTTNLGIAKFDLTWFVAESKSQILCAVEYRDSRFRRETIDLMIEHWISMLKSIARSPGQQIRELDFRTELDHFAGDALRGNRESGPRRTQWRCITELIGAKAKELPDQEAVRFDGRSLTYRQLIEKTDQLSASLAQLGVKQNVPVAVCMPRSMEMLIGILAILKSGGAYVPFDPDQPLARLAKSARSIGVEIALGWDDEISSIFPHMIDPRMIDPRIQLGSQINAPPSKEVDSASLAYILQTSGSTGEPKYVEVSRQSLLDSTMDRHMYYDLRPTRFLMVSPIWFDSSIAGVFWTLSCGGTLVIPTDDQLQDIQSIENLINGSEVTTTLMLPTYYQILLAHANPAKLQSLQCVIVAGEACARSVVKSHFRIVPRSQLFNEYGPTEASVWATVTELHGHEQFIPIGRSVSGTPVHLRGRKGEKIPVGGVGEIVIGGSRLANGYRNDLQQTSLRFVSNDDTKHPGRCYRTGDLARLLRDGSLVHVGRIDDQLKVNGMRVDPAEIEAALLEIDGILDAGVALVDRPHDIEKASTEEVIASLRAMPSQDVERLLESAERIGQHRNETVSTGNGHARVSIELIDPGYLKTPRSRQRKWLLDRALQETISDLEALNMVASRMVPGSDSPHLPRDISIDQLTPQEIMEDWQTPLMKSMADWVCQSGGDVLEIGFGRGVAAT